MRSDESTQDIDQQDWKQRLEKNSDGKAVERLMLSGSRKASFSFSGSERNRLFVKLDGEFEDLSGISGLDSKLDSRNVALFDYNRDGFQDFLVTSTNGQSLQVFRNNLSDIADRNFVCVRLAGAKQDAGPNSENRTSNRDGIGAWVTVSTGGAAFDRELRCGEGFASQNSSTIVFGIGESESVESIVVKWPSGATSSVGRIESGHLVKIYESESDSKTGKGFEVEPYTPVTESEPVQRTADRFPVETFSLKSEKPVVLLTSMATWCSSSRQALGTVKAIRDRFDSSIDVCAFSTDDSDSSSKLESYRQKFDPAYRFLAVDKKAVDTFEARVIGEHGDAPLPSTILMTADGGVIDVFLGMPSISDVATAIEGFLEK